MTAKICPGGPDAETVGPDCPLFTARLRRALLIERQKTPGLSALIRQSATRPNPLPPTAPPTRPELPRGPAPTIVFQRQKGALHD